MIFFWEKLFFAAKMQPCGLVYRHMGIVFWRQNIYLFENFDVLFFCNLNILRSKVQDAMSAAEIFWGVSKMSKKVHLNKNFCTQLEFSIYSRLKKIFL